MTRCDIDNLLLRYAFFYFYIRDWRLDMHGIGTGDLDRLHSKTFSCIIP